MKIILIAIVLIGGVFLMRYVWESSKEMAALIEENQRLWDEFIKELEKKTGLTLGAKKTRGGGSK